MLDTSALYPLVTELREKLLDYSDVLAVLDLAFYEMGNVLWKEYRRGKIRDLAAVAEFFEEVLMTLQIMRVPTNLAEILKLAVNHGLTFYDASYIYVAQHYGLKLVTEDKDLLKFPQAISVRELLHELEPGPTE